MERAVRISEVPVQFVAPLHTGTQRCAQTLGFPTNPRAYLGASNALTHACVPCGRAHHHPVHNHLPTTRKMSSVTLFGGGLGRVAPIHLGVVGD